jgi:hypothetical protein
MTRKSPPDRLAATAIAAVLALLSTAATAQDDPANDGATVSPVSPMSPMSPPVGPPEGAETVAPTLPATPPGSLESSPVPPLADIAPAVDPTLGEITGPASNGPVYAPPRAVVQPVMPTHEQAREQAQAQEDAAAPGTLRASRSAAAPAMERESALPPAQADASGSTAGGQPAPADGPLAAPRRAEVRTADARATAPIVTVDARRAEQNNDALYWGLAGAGGLLLLGVTAYAFAGAPRRPRARASRPTVVASPSVVASMAGPPLTAIPEAPSSIAPAPVDSAAFRPARDGVLEAMVAAAPSAANPFLTRKKRLRRARFILAHGRPDADRAPPPSVEATAPEQVMAHAQPMSASRRQAPRFTLGEGIRLRPPGWKPAST